VDALPIASLDDPELLQISCVSLVKATQLQMVILCDHGGGSLKSV
jgi:hypothetical protein